MFIMGTNDSKKVKTQDSKLRMDFSEEVYDTQMGFC